MSPSPPQSLTLFGNRSLSNSGNLSSPWNILLQIYISEFFLFPYHQTFLKGKTCLCQVCGKLLSLHNYVVSPPLGKLYFPAQLNSHVALWLLWQIKCEVTYVTFQWLCKTHSLSLTTEIVELCVKYQPVYLSDYWAEHFAILHWTCSMSKN